MPTLKEQLAAANTANTLQKKEIKRLLSIIHEKSTTVDFLYKNIDEHNAEMTILNAKLEACGLLTITLRETQAEILTDKKHYYKETKRLAKDIDNKTLRINDLEKTIDIVDKLTSANVMRQY